MSKTIEYYHQQDQNEVVELAKKMPDKSILIRATSADNNTIIQNCNFTINFNLDNITTKLKELYAIDERLAWGFLDFMKTQNVIDLKKLNENSD